ncbi:MAG: hypothetical protein JO354_01255 [Verrucomicrobia bacterium]|nr:hypothetical protein [Verrucomicrobiota bacterium]
MAGTLLAVGLLCAFCLLRVPQRLLTSTAFNYVVEQRALVGIGVGGVVACCLYLDRCEPLVNAREGAVLWLAFVAATVALVWWIWSRSPGVFPHPRQALLSLVIHLGIIGLFFFPLTRRWALPATAVALVITNFGVNPVMRGLSPLLASPVVATVEKIRASDTAGKWIVYNNRFLPQLIKAAGVDVLNGTKIVPDINFFRALDPDAEPIYDRYAHIECRLPAAQTKPAFQLLHLDYFIVDLAPDLPLLHTAGYRYLAMAGAWRDAQEHGFTLIARLRASDVWFYKSR